MGVFVLYLDSVEVPGRFVSTFLSSSEAGKNVANFVGQDGVIMRIREVIKCFTDAYYTLTMIGVGVLPLVCCMVSFCYGAMSYMEDSTQFLLLWLLLS